MELGGRAQVIAYNLALVITFVGLRSNLEISLVGIVMGWLAVTWTLFKSWSFPALSGLAVVEDLSAVWWAEPDQQQR